MLYKIHCTSMQYRPCKNHEINRIIQSWYLTEKNSTTVFNTNLIALVGKSQDQGLSVLSQTATNPPVATLGGVFIL